MHPGMSRHPNKIPTPHNPQPSRPRARGSLASAIAAQAWFVLAIVGMWTISGIRASPTTPTTPLSNPFNGPATVSGASKNHDTTAGSCTQCHTFDPVLSHPVGVRPSMAVPAGFPLENGQISCTTCHTDEQHASGGSGAMLRPGMDQANMCQQCHAAGTGRAIHHGSPMKAHLAGSELHFTRSRPAVPATEETRDCMACHDGSIAMDAGSHRVQIDSDMGSSDDHPVGVLYRSAPGRSEAIILKDAARLDRRVRLFSSTVGCGSCHSVYSKQKALLVMENRGSRLCLQCHQS